MSAIPGSDAFDEATTSALLRQLEPFVTEHKRRRIDEVLAWRTRYLTVVVEDLFQSHNASAVVRTCDCLGVQDLHVIESRNPFEPSGGVTVGAGKWVDVGRHRRTRDCLSTLRSAGYRIVAMTLRTPSTPVSELPVDERFAVWFGSEEPGLSEEAHQGADVYAHLPMFGFTQSFNVSVSVALTLAPLLERVRRSNAPWALTAPEKRRLRLAWYTRIVPHAHVHIRQVLKSRET